jgi:hypothetical protein
MRSQVIAAVLSLGISSAAWAQFPAGGEFRVNTFTVNYQTQGMAAVAPRGDFLIVWNSGLQDGSNHGVYAQRYDAAGTPQGPEFQMNTTVTGLQYATGVAADDAGRYIVVWISSGPGQDGSGRGIVGRVFSPTGVPLTGEFLINAFTPGRQTAPAVTAQPGGSFVVVWESAGQDGNSYAIVGRRFDSRGGALTGDFIVNAFTPGAQQAPEISSDAAGNFVVVWHSAGQDGHRLGSFGRRFNSAGTPISGEFQVNVYTTDEQRFPQVSVLPDGRFVVAWESGYGSQVPTQDNQRFGSFARRYDAAGNPLTGDLLLNVYTIDHQHFPTVTAYGNGSFLAAWYSQDQLGFNNQDVFARQFLAGVPGPEFLVNAFTPVQQFLAHLDSDDVGNVVAVWDSVPGQDGSSNGVYARRYGGLLPFALAVDASALGSSNGNRVLEPGETVLVQPSWRNVNGASLIFDGTAPTFTGPAGATYTVVDGNASYGTVPNNTVRSCTTTTDCYAVGVAAAGRPAAHWDALLRENISAPLSLSKAWSVHVGDTFSDVPRANPFYRFVETVLHENVMIGCTPTQFCPFLAVPRDQMSMFVLLSKEPTVPPACVAGLEMFADVPAGSFYCPWIEELARRGVVSGCGGGNYCPGSPVSRQELAVYLLRTLEGPTYTPVACGVPVFNDVPASSPFCRWVEELARRGVVSGCGGGAYCPAAAVARDQMSVFLSVTFGLALYGP